MKQTRRLIWPLCLAAVVYCVSAYFSQGFYHADEHFQLIEFAEAKMGDFPEERLAWEYNARLRPATQVGICVAIFSSLETFGVQSPYIKTFVLRLLTALLALFCVAFFSRAAVKSGMVKQGKTGFYIWAFLLACLPFLNVRFSSETWAGLLFLLPLGIVLLKRTNEVKQLFMIGLLAGCSFLFRYQMGLILVGLLAYLLVYHHLKLKGWVALIGGLLLAVFVGFCIDSWFYGEFVFTPWNYFKVNILDNRASDFGVQPWYFYVQEVLHLFPWGMGILLLLLVLVFLIRYLKHPISWCVIPFVAAHFFIPHKELRFLFPLANLLPLMLFVAAQSSLGFVAGKRVKQYVWPMGNAAGWAVLLLNLILLLPLLTMPAGIGRMRLTQYIYTHTGTAEVNLIHTPWANPYNPWVNEIHFYKNARVHAKEVKNLCAVQDTILSNKQLNFLVFREIDLQYLQEDCLLNLRRMGFVKVKQSMPEISSAFDGILPINTDENMHLYQLETPPKH